MDSPVHSLSIPRLRLSRQSFSNLYPNGGLENHQVAGPSRRSDPHLVDLNSDTDQDEQPTPKMSSATPILPADTPAARLRALLSRVPNSSSRAPPAPAPVSSSELDSDFDAPHSGPATPSIARESLKDLFSRALRDPGDTPQKGRPRRNSIDTSEVEASPRVEKERANHKGKRRSLSDDELELPSSTQPYLLPFDRLIHRFTESLRSEASFKSSQASTFDNLRARLTNSHAPLKNQPAPSSPFQRMSFLVPAWSHFLIYSASTLRIRTRHSCK